jgi:hypothetical protein
MALLSVQTATHLGTIGEIDVFTSTFLAFHELMLASIIQFMIQQLTYPTHFSYAIRHLFLPTLRLCGNYCQFVIGDYRTFIGIAVCFAGIRCALGGDLIGYVWQYEFG